MPRAFAVLAVALALTVPASAESSDGEHVLALVSTGTRAELVQLDPRSLEPVFGVPRVALGLQDIPWATSPDGSKLAVGSGRTTSLVFVDLQAMRRVGRLGTAFMTALAWPVPRRLLLLERGALRMRFVVIDPETRRVLVRRKIGVGEVLAAATTEDGLAVLIAPSARVGTPWLLVLDARGSARRVSLPRISAGQAKEKNGERYRVWYRNPGLAVDRGNDRAYVVTAGPRVAEVELDTLEVSYREVRVMRSRAVSGTSGARGRSGGNVLATGTQRQAHWLGNGFIAVAGWNDRLVRDPSGRQAQSDEPAGVRILDTRRWTSRSLVEDARWLHATDDLILSRTNPTGGPGTTLEAFTHDGKARFRVELPSASFGIQSAGDYAYLGLGDEYRSHPVTAVDIRTGTVAGKPLAPGWVLLVSPTQPQFCRCYTGTTIG